MKNRPNVESWWFWLALILESISEIKSRLQIKISQICRMSNHDVFDLFWDQNPFLNSNLDRRSKFQKSAESRIMMILTCADIRIHFWDEISIADQKRMARLDVKLHSSRKQINYILPFLNSNLDRISKFQKSAECWIIMILTCTDIRFHFWTQISIGD